MSTERIDNPVDKSRARKGPRGIMNEDEGRGCVLQRFEPEANGVLTLHATQSEGQKLGWSVPGGLGRLLIECTVITVNDNQHPANPRMAQEAGKCMGEQGLAEQGPVLLGQAAPSPDAPAGCDDQGDNVAMHGSLPLDEAAQAIALP
jgi:hypothetical protein